MANQTKETKDKKTNTPKDVKDMKKNAKKGQTTPLNTSSKQGNQGPCPPGQTWNPVTGQCE